MSSNLEIKKLEKKIKCLKLWFWIPSVLSATIMILCICIILCKWDTKLDTSLIISFVGILATFVVISSYSQVKDIENKFEKAISELKDKTEEIDKLKQKADNLVEILKIKENSYLFYSDVYNSLNNLSNCFYDNENYDMSFICNIIKISLMEPKDQIFTIQRLIDDCNVRESKEYIPALKDFIKKIKEEEQIIE
ncbi:hypothetical protein FACS1894153_0590 [Bacteroidia bacterium]|nr:hypothetical protein FACS1894153_0590 [Bacteroidia bacterium]